MVSHWTTIHIKVDTLNLLKECKKEMQKHHKDIFASPQDISYDKILHKMGRFYLDE